jgi:hypothetical protein
MPIAQGRFALADLAALPGVPSSVFFILRSKEIHKAMKTTQGLLVVFAAALALLASTGCAKLKARDHLNKGVQAYKNSKFEAGDRPLPASRRARSDADQCPLYLATAFAQQYIPGADTPDNNRYAEQAIDQYKQVLQKSIPRTSTASRASPTFTCR